MPKKSSDDTPAFLSATASFSKDIEQMVHEHGMNFIDAVVTWCDKHGVEVEHAATLIKRDQVFKAKIEAEASKQNMLKAKTVALPI